MDKAYLDERVQARIVELFRTRAENEEQARLSLGELVREGARVMLETALEVEVEEALGCMRYQRGEPGRKGYRNGVAERKVKTLAGEVCVRKPKVRDTEEPFRSEVLRAWQRRCDELSSMIPGLYLEGLSTRDFTRALRTFWGDAGLSKSTISRLNKKLHEEFAAWRQRDLSEEGLVFLYLDAIYAGVRFDTSDKEAVLVAHGIRKDGSRSVLSIRFGGRESTASWSEVLHDLNARQLPEPMLVISDGNPGLVAAVKGVWPDVPRQRCTKHRTKNVTDKVPKKVRDEIRKACNRIWYAKDLETAKDAVREFVEMYGKRYEAATKCLLAALPECLTFFRFDKTYWQRIRTSNPLERTFKEVRRRTKVVGRFPTESAALSLIYGVLTAESHKWRGLRLDPGKVLQIKQTVDELKTNPIVIDTAQEAA